MEEVKELNKLKETGKRDKSNEKMNQNQFFDFITGEEISWQQIIYDLVNTEQLDPWDIDLAVLAEKYIDVIQKIEEADFFVSSKVLLACSLLLKFKADFLANNYIQSLDELLYGKQEQKKYEPVRIEIDDDELPLLVPKTPLPRFRKVTLNELMSALSNAIDTETRRIKKEIKKSQAEKSALIVLPSIDRITLKERTMIIYQTIKNYFQKPEMTRMKYSELALTSEERRASFLPVLHLTTQERLYLEQENHFDEIFMMLKKMEKEMGDISESFQEDINETKEKEGKFDE